MSFGTETTSEDEEGAPTEHQRPRTRKPRRAGPGLAGEALDQLPDGGDHDEDRRDRKDCRQVRADDALQVRAEAGDSRGKGGGDGFHRSNLHFFPSLSGDEFSEQSEQGEYPEAGQAAEHR